uniref:Citrate transporter-like domain-containing protein n=1 Tax=Strigamia maritima TaxID=126957 RepID=T1J6C4_STRMM
MPSLRRVPIIHKEKVFACVKHEVKSLGEQLTSMLISILATRALHRWRQFVLVVAPFILLPLIIVVATPESKCAFVVLLVTTYWVTSALPLAVTSLLPIVLFPLLGILSSTEISHSYMKDSNVMLLAGIIAAIAIENCNLHRRIALRILLLAGTSPKWLMLNFMCTTAFLSMWINNTAATSLMVPIVESILQELSSSLDPPDSEKTNSDILSNNSNTNLVHCTVMETEVTEQYLTVPESTTISTESIRKKALAALKMENYRKGTLLSIAYASNFGGSTTVTGTGPNLVLMELLASLYQGAETGLTFFTWMLFAVPCAILCLILAWLWLQIVFLGPRSLYFKFKFIYIVFPRKERHAGKIKFDQILKSWQEVILKNRIVAGSVPCESGSKDSNLRVKNAIKRQYKEMGAINFHQGIILALFTLLVILWVFRRPEFIPGWSSFFPAGFIKDSVAGIGVVILMFAAPSRPDLFCCDCSQDNPPLRALTWPVVQKKIPWGILLLMGGGFALADGSKVHRYKY